MKATKYLFCRNNVFNSQFIVRSTFLNRLRVRFGCKVIASCSLNIPPSSEAMKIAKAEFAEAGLIEQCMGYEL